MTGPRRDFGTYGRGWEPPDWFMVLLLTHGILLKDVRAVTMSDDLATVSLKDGRDITVEVPLPP